MAKFPGELTMEATLTLTGRAAYEAWLVRADTVKMGRGATVVITRTLGPSTLAPGRSRRSLGALEARRDRLRAGLAHADSDWTQRITLPAANLTIEGVS